MLLYRNLIFVRQNWMNGVSGERVFYTLGRPEPSDPDIVLATSSNWVVMSRAVFPEENIRISNYDGWADSEGTSNLTRELDAFYQIATPIAWKVAQGINIQTAIKEEIFKQVYRYNRHGFPYPTDNHLYVFKLLIGVYNVNLDDQIGYDSVRNFLRQIDDIQPTFSRIPPFPTENT